ncbi:MAG TPA: 5-formyltetrahydrofolate cyclo-ligase [Saliniramus sp.]|nr:5-formyltetrahydrofolate cyclo-ligase [Saliniramus sp.]
MNKEALRTEGLALRDGLSPNFREAASQAIMQRVLDLPELATPGIVSAYWPIRSEVDPRPLLEALDHRGVALSLPRVNHPFLSFHEWRPGEPLQLMGFGVSEPMDEAQALLPDVLLIPLARFDRALNRIGYGKGHYDRAIAGLTERKAILTIGLAFSVQETETIPVEDHDRRLDLVVTEAETIRA